MAKSLLYHVSRRASTSACPRHGLLARDLIDRGPDLLQCMPPMLCRRGIVDASTSRDAYSKPLDTPSRNAPSRAPPSSTSSCSTLIVQSASTLSNSTEFYPTSSSSEATLSTAMDSLMRDKIDRAQNILGYEFTDSSLLWEALQVAGSGVLAVQGLDGLMRPVPIGNQRLAVHGDAAIAYSVCRPWFSSGASKGQWTAQRNGLLGNTNLERVGRESGLDLLMNVNPLDPVQPSVRLTATLVEAVLGAVDLDGGNENMRVVMKNIGLIREAAQPTY